jgi:diamine N-acetyltransferase
MNIIELDRGKYKKIKGLWENLNRLHGELSENFKNHFASFTFEKRMQSLLCKEHLTIFVAADHSEYLGYCIVSLEKGRGEIDSIYIDSIYRKQGIGAKLIQEALSWLSEKQCNVVNVSVAEGNESVLEFYKQFGFYKSSVVLQRTASQPFTAADSQDEAGVPD